MKELNEVAANYAAGKTNEVMDKAIAQAYADGYRDGYKDREEEIPVDLRDNKTKYVDLGLPSGTLWSSSYEKEDDEYIYSPYEKAILQEIPTTEQWDELYSNCRWDYICNNANVLYRVDCVGPNGHVISFYVTGFINAIQKKNSSESFFWLKEDINGNQKKAVHLCHKKQSVQGYQYYDDIRVVENTFSGFKLPIRLVRKK